MRKAYLLGAFALVLVVLCSLLVSAPARLLNLVLPQDQLVMQGLSGTLWRGSASRCMLRLPAGYLHLGAVQWSLEPLSLLVLAPRIQLASEWGTQRINGELVLPGAQDLGLRELEGRVSADLLRHFAPLTLGGSFSVQIKELQLRDGLPYHGAGRVVWERAAWLSPQGPVPLGTYALDFEQAPGAALTGKVISLAGPLAAQGSVALEGRSYKLDILVSSEEALDPQLQEALSLIAAPDAEGHRLYLEGEF